MSTPCARQAAAVSMRRINQCNGLARSPTTPRTPNQGQVVYHRNSNTSTTTASLGSRTIPKVCWTLHLLVYVSIAVQHWIS